MSKILKLIGRLVNGLSLASYELGTLVYRASPIKQRQQIIIPNLEKNKVTRVDLLGELDFNLLVTGIDADVENDDEKELNEKNAQYNQTPPFNIWVTVINRKTDKVVKRLAFAITSYPDYTNEIILEPKYIYDIKPSITINSLTFTGEPVYLKDCIIFLNGVVE